MLISEQKVQECDATGLHSSNTVWPKEIVTIKLKHITDIYIIIIKPNNMMDQIKWGMIGCGNVTEKKSGPAFNKTANSALVAVMARNLEKAADYASRHNVPRWYNNVDDLINDPEVNSIYIATPPDVHIESAVKAMREGKPFYV